MAGMLPIVGIVPDLINVEFSPSRGKWGTADFNLVVIQGNSFRTNGGDLDRSSLPR